MRKHFLFLFVATIIFILSLQPKKAVANTANLPSITKKYNTKNERFQIVLKYILKQEGGYVDNPHDLGRATNKGITLTTYSTFLKRQATKNELKNITNSEVYQIYKAYFWDVCQIVNVEPGFDYIFFSMCVNSGPQKAINFLQKFLNVKQTSVINVETLEALDNLIKAKGVVFAINSFASQRALYYKSLSKFPIFGRGWLRILKETNQIALSLVKN